MFPFFESEGRGFNSLRARSNLLDGVRTVLDVVGGVGAFAVPLAERGLSVTMLDLSPAMLAIARRNGAHLPTLTLIEGNAIDLSAFVDRAFDLVLGGGNAEGALHPIRSGEAASVDSPPPRPQRLAALVEPNPSVDCPALFSKRSLISPLRWTRNRRCA